MEKETVSTKVRNYAIAGVCLVFVILMGSLAVSFSDRRENVSVWAQCSGGSANVFISTDKALKNVKCVALDGGFFANPDVFIGDLSRNSRDVCKFVQSKDTTTEPLRFEVWYDGKAQSREVCNWQFGSGGVD